MTFTVYPAIDLREGRVVRLRQGDYARQNDYAVAPVDLARTYAEAGAAWLHVVDLDGARAGRAANLATITQLARTGIRVQAGGGVRTAGDLADLFDAGIARVVLGSLAIRDPDTACDWIARHGPECITIALDVRRRHAAWQLASNGWEREETATLDERATQYARAGARHLLCTDIDRDGMLSGPNLDLLAHLRTLVPGMAVQVSGGARHLADIRAARAAGAAGIVLGRALLDGRFTPREALAC